MTTVLQGFILPHGPVSLDQDANDRLAGHMTYFDSMVDLIPPKYYIHKETPEDDVAWKRYKKNAKETAPKQKLKEQSKKAKRSRFEEGKTVTELQKELAEEAAVEHKEFQNVTAKRDSNKKKSNDDVKVQAIDAAAPSSQHAKSLDELRERLHARIAQLKSQRNASESNTEAIKRRRIDSAKANDKKKAANKNKKAATEAQKAEAIAKLNGTTNGSAASSGKGGAQSTQQETTRDSFTEDISFGTLKVVDTSKAEYVAAATGANKGKNKKSLRDLLAKAEKNQRKLDQVAEAKKNAEWESALKRAQGEKVMNDPKLLKKAIKRREKQKEKSKKQWDARRQVEDEKREARQDKRKQNLQQRQDHRMQKLARQKGISRPGFEGKKTKMLNE